VNVADKHLFTDQFDIVCRIRYRKQNTLCRVVFLEDGNARVELAEALESIAPDKPPCFINKEKCLEEGL